MSRSWRRKRRRLRIEDHHQITSEEVLVVKPDIITSSSLHSRFWQLSNSRHMRKFQVQTRRSVHLRLMRELRALQKARSLQDPVTTPLVSSSSLSRGLRLDDGYCGGHGGARNEKCSRNGLRRRDSMAAPVHGKNGDRLRSSSSNGVSGRKWMHTTPSACNWDGELQIGVAGAATRAAAAAAAADVDEINSREEGRRMRNFRHEGVMNPSANGRTSSRYRGAARKTSSEFRGIDAKRRKNTEKAKSSSVRESDEEEEKWQTDAAATRDSKLTKEFVSENFKHSCLLSNCRRNRSFQESDLGESRFQTGEEEDDEELSPAERETIWTRRRHASSSQHREGNSEVPILLRTQQSRSKTTTRRKKVHTSKSKPEAMQINGQSIDSREEVVEGRRQEASGCSKTRQNRGDEEQQHQHRQPELPRNLVVYKELELLLQGCETLPWNQHHHHQLLSNKNFNEAKRESKTPPPTTDPPGGLLKKSATRKKKMTVMSIKSSRKGSSVSAVSKQDQYNQGNAAADSTISSSDRQEMSLLPFLMSKDDDDDSRRGSSSCSCCNDSMRFALEPLERHDIVSHAQEQLCSKHLTLYSDEEGMKNKEQKAHESLLRKEPKLHARIAQASEDEKKAHRTLSQKYRPKSFNEVIGQSMVVKSLTMAIRKHKVAPAYLFTGPSGTGKTTAARIFAATINCSGLASELESQECTIRTCQKDEYQEEDSCSSFDDDAYAKEIDAAVASKMDLKHMLQQSMPRQRNLSSPSSSAHACYGHRYKVLIVEGCHLLCTHIWNTFLTLLEEPPSNLVFILITTETDQLPLTVTSRCQRFSFNKLKESDIIKRLQLLALKEGLNVEKDAFAAIASRANGSLRDAEMLLDQLSLLDKKISLDMVQELMGLIPENKLLDLLDLALSADTVHIVRQMRQLLDLGVDPLSLVTQLASLITNLLAGSFNVQQCEIPEDGFFKRDFSRKEELRQLRQALKVLSEAEKQLRVSGDRPTWLTAALLQFAPDCSFIPSSANTSTQQRSPLSSFKAGFSKEETARESLPLTGLQTKDEVSASQKIKSSQQSTISTSVPTLAMYLETKRRKRMSRHHPLSIQADAKMHPAKVPLDNLHHSKPGSSDWCQQQQQHWAEADDVALCVSDSYKPVYSRGFQRLHHQRLEEVWNQVLQLIHSDSMQWFLVNHGILLAVSIANDDTHAIVQLEFQQLHHKLKAERSRSQICHAFQMVLNCPVELQICLLTTPPPINTNDLTIARKLVFDNYSAGLSTTSALKDMKLNHMAVENLSTRKLMMSSSHNGHLLHPRQKPQHSLIITQQETASPFARMQEPKWSKNQAAWRESSSRCRSEGGMAEQSNSFHARVVLHKEKGLNRSRVRSKSKTAGQLSNSFHRIKESGSRSFSSEYQEWQTLNEPQGRGEKKVMKHQCQRQRLQKLHEKQTLHKKTILQKPAMTSGGIGLPSVSEQWNLRLEQPHDRRSVLCWKTAYSCDKHKGKKLVLCPRAKGKSLLLRLVPCTRSKFHTPITNANLRCHICELLAVACV